MMSVHSQPAGGTVVVFERRPHWGPILQRSVMGENVTVRECRTLKDVDDVLVNFPDAIVLLDLDAAPIEGLRWLASRNQRGFPSCAIVCASPELAALEWHVREAGAIAFLSDETPPHEVATLCVRQLRLCSSQS